MKYKFIFFMYFFPSNIFTSNILFFYNFLFFFKYYITVFVTYILRRYIWASFSLPRTRYFRSNYFLIKKNIFSTCYPFLPTYSVFHPYCKICEFSKRQILKSLCSNIVPETEIDILVHLLLIHF